MLNKSSSKIMFIISLSFVSIILLISRCSCGVEKPDIKWTNYSYKEGLGKQQINTSALSKSSSVYSTQGFEDLPIEEGLEVWDMAVTKDESGKTIWVSSWAPVIYSNDGGDNWNVLEDSLRYGFSL